MTHRTQGVGRLLFAVFITLLLAFIVNRDLLHRISSVVLELESSAKTDVGVYFKHAPATDTYSARRFNRSTALPKQTKVEIPLYSNRISRIKVLLKSEQAHWRLKSLSYTSHYAPTVTLRGKALQDALLAYEPSTHITAVGDDADITATEAGATFTLKDRLKLSNPYINLLPMGIGYFIYLLLEGFSLDAIPAFSGLEIDPNSPYNYELDGLRGLAALSVVADHTWSWFTGTGTAGVWLFFALSGYLLAIPFVRRPELAVQGKGIARYYQRRLLRIIPMYYTLVFLYFVLFNRSNYFGPHLLFMQANGHFWTIPEELLFYLFLPALMMALYVAGRVPYLKMALLVGITAWLLWLGDRMPITLFSIPDSHPAYLAWFLIGVVVSYTLNQPLRLALPDWLKRPWLQQLVGAIALLTFVGFVCLSSIKISQMLYHTSEILIFKHKDLFGLVAGFLVFAAVFARRSVWGAFLRLLPLRSYGIVGYSAYLLHPILAEVVRNYTLFYLGYRASEASLFILTVLLTWLISVVTYSLIEYPFLHRRRGQASSLTTKPAIS